MKKNSLICALIFGIAGVAGFANFANAGSNVDVLVNTVNATTGINTNTIYVELPGRTIRGYYCDNVESKVLGKRAVGAGRTVADCAFVTVEYPFPHFTSKKAALTNPPVVVNPTDYDGDVVKVANNLVWFNCNFIEANRFLYDGTEYRLEYVFQCEE